MTEVAPRKSKWETEQQRYKDDSFLLQSPLCFLKSSPCASLHVIRACIHTSPPVCHALYIQSSLGILGELPPELPTPTALWTPKSSETRVLCTKWRRTMRIAAPAVEWKPMDMESY